MSRARDTANQINRINSSAADATAITVDSSEKVGIGVSNPSDYYPNWSNLVIGNLTDFTGMTIASSPTGEGTIAFADGTSGTAEYSGWIQYAHQNGFMNFATEAVERIRIDSDGLKFNGDTAAANALSDYEEGSHDCTVTMSSGSCSLYSNYNKIKYTKIGNLVMIQGQIRVESVSSPSGEMLVSMPFSMDTTADEGSNISGSLVRTYLGNAPTGGLFLHGTMVFNRGHNCTLQWSKSGSATVNHVPVANEYLLFNFTYNVA